MADRASAPEERNLQRRYLVAAAVVVLFALALRVLYVATVQIDQPIYGDGLHYFVCAVNLVQHGVYSSSAPGGVLVPDSYRAPGFPLLIAAGMVLGGGDSGAAIHFVQYTQALLGAATVLLAILVARSWLCRGAALAVGLLIACWPHLITFTATLMSETLLGFWLALAFWLLCVGERRRQVTWIAAAGLAYSAAYLVNPIIVFVAPLAALVLLRRHGLRLAFVLVVAALAAPFGWGLRGAQLETPVSQFHHAVDGLVWGSSPLYLPAFNSRWVSPEAKEIVALEQEETRQVLANPLHGVGVLLTRMAQDPLGYLSWYVLQKPYLLWGWHIVVGTGDIYYPVTRWSPLERIPLLHAMKLLLQRLNPLLFILAMVAAFGYAARELRRQDRRRSPPQRSRYLCCTSPRSTRC